MARAAKPLKGVCHLHSETGKEGGYWAFQDSRHISADGRHWSYNGLHVLKDGDRLTIFDKENPKQIVWSGEISLIQHPLFSQHAFGMWIHADQKGIEREKWATWFFKEYPAELTVAKLKKK